MPPKSWPQQTWENPNLWLASALKIWPQLPPRSLKFSKIPFGGSSLNVFVIIIVLIFVFLVVFVGHVMFSQHYDHISQRSKVSKVALWWCSLNVFVIVIVLLVVFVFLLARSCFLITLIKCLNDLRVFSKYICHCLCYCLFVGHFLITLIKCLKSQKSRRLLVDGVL